MPTLIRCNLLYFKKIIMILAYIKHTQSLHHTYMFLAILPKFDHFECLYRNY